jgi:hypothetical protein
VNVASKVVRVPTVGMPDVRHIRTQDVTDVTTVGVMPGVIPDVTTDVDNQEIRV